MLPSTERTKGEVDMPEGALPSFEIVGQSLLKDVGEWMCSREIARERRGELCILEVRDVLIGSIAR